MILGAMALGISMSAAPRQAIHPTPLVPRQLAQRADLVLLGRVIAMESKDSGRDGGFSEITLQVAEVWKGQLPDGVFKVLQRSNLLGERRTRIAGEAEFRLGEEVVIFAKRQSGDTGVTIEMGQGKFSLTRTSTNAPTVSNGYWGAAEPRKVGGIQYPTPQSMTLSSLRNEIAESSKREMASENPR